MRKDIEMENIILLMDNASIHKAKGTFLRIANNCIL